MKCCSDGWTDEIFDASQGVGFFYPLLMFDSHDVIEYPWKESFRNFIKLILNHLDNKGYKKYPPFNIQFTNWIFKPDFPMIFYTGHTLLMNRRFAEFCFVSTLLIGEKCEFDVKCPICQLRFLNLNICHHLMTVHAYIESYACLMCLIKTNARVGYFKTYDDFNTHHIKYHAFYLQNIGLTFSSGRFDFPRVQFSETPNRTLPTHVFPPVRGTHLYDYLSPKPIPINDRLKLNIIDDVISFSFSNIQPIQPLMNLSFPPSQVKKPKKHRFVSKIFIYFMRLIIYLGNTTFEGATTKEDIQVPTLSLVVSKKNM